MSAYNPPSVSLPIFDTLVFEPSDTPLTYSLAKKYFLTYPTAQGSETLQKVGQAIGNNNIQFGDLTSFTSTSGANNIAIGNATLPFLSSGNQNVAIGTGALNVATTGFDNTAVGYYALGDDLQTNNGVTAIGSLAGRHSIGSNSTYLGHQTGQQSSDASTYDYLTCIGTLSGREASVCASNRIILGSSTGNENILMAGSGDIAHRNTAQTINLFATTTGAINIGTTTNTNGIYIGNFRSYRAGSDYVFQNTSGGTQFQGQPTGSTSIATNQTFGSVIIGSTSSTNGGSMTISSPNGTISIGSTNVTSANINIGNSLTSGNITLGNSTSGAGRIVMNRNIVLPTSTSFVTPAAGELGYKTSIALTTSGNSSTGSATLPANNVSITQWSTAFTFPAVGVWMCNAFVTFTRAGSTGGVSIRVGISTATNTAPDEFSKIDMYTGATQTKAISPQTWTTVINVTSTSTNYYITGNTGLATTSDTVTMDTTGSTIWITRIA